MLKQVAALAAMALLLSRPRAAALGAAAAMARCCESVAPALFPFLALLPLLTGPEASRGCAARLARPVAALFNLPAAAAPGVAVALAAGTPAGALAARRAAGPDGLNRGELGRVAAAFQGFSPAFLVSGVGAGMLGSAALGCQLLGAQLMTQLTLAALLRRHWQGRIEAVPRLTGAGAERPMVGAALTMLGICGAMTLFGALAGALGAWIGPGPAGVALCLMDVPSGALWLARLPMPEALRLPLLAAMCGFGGLCMIAQSLGALAGCGVVVWEYVALRVLAGLLCAGYMALLQTVPWQFHLPMRNNILGFSALLAVILVLPALKKWRHTVS